MGARGVQQLLVLLVGAAVTCLASSSRHSDHTFLIFNDQTSKCLSVDKDQLKLDSCTESRDSSRWKWGSNHRLYNLGAQKCLALNLSNRQNPLTLVPCDSKLMLWWRCSGGHVFGASRYGLGVKNGTVVGTLQCEDTWRLNGTSENICEIPYQVVYTTGGTANGRPCDFPFQTNGAWFHDCASDASENGEWCLDADGKRGNCLKPVNGCTGSWTLNSTLQHCYQLNKQSALTWKEAYMACKSQEADLLSISSEEELMYITVAMDPPDFVWLGLNRLDSAAGWQWSDNSPLSFVNWREGISAFTVLDGLNCGRLHVASGQWEAYPCDVSLPYMCKKRDNSAASDSTDWHYSETSCDGNWTAYNGFCYAVQQPNNWTDAELSCQKENGSLISLHSLADIELVVTKLQSDNENIWSGFQSQSLPHVYKWSDGTEARFTYWDQNEPLPPFNNTPSCVSFSGKTGRWHVRGCEEKLNSVCKRPGTIKNGTTSDTGCPQDKNWRRHGQYCYLVNKTEVTFADSCQLTITNKFEQEFLNSLIREQTVTDGKYFWTSLNDSENSGDYYWQTVSGKKKDLTYSNWNMHEPAFPGGCVAMSGGDSLGQWEVKDCQTFKAQSIYKKVIGSAEEEVVPPKSNVTKCPDGWIVGTNLYCYKVFHKERLLRQRTWEEAEGICEEFGGHLASFPHLKEMQEFNTLLKPFLSGKRSIWVGLNKRNLRSWEWSDGRPISSTLLNEFQEEDYALRDCAALEVNLVTKRIVWSWHIKMMPEQEYSLQPFHCDALLDWVCQVPMGTDVKQPEWYQPDSEKKNVSSLVIDSSEYWFVFNTRLSHKAADLYCASKGSELASINSYHLDIIQDHLKARQSEEMGIYTLHRWWVRSVGFRNHYPLMLHRMIGAEFLQCPFISAVRYFPDFQPLHCNDKLPFICRNFNLSKLETESSKPKIFSGNCPANWTAFENKCFLKVSPSSPLYKTFSDAEKLCRTYGGTLPTISNQREQDFLTYFSMGLVHKIWIGLRLTVNSHDNTWSDGSDVTYTNFNPLLQGRFRRFEFNPLDQEKNQQCVFFLNNPKSSFVGTWDYTACSDQQFVSICQKNRDTNGTAPPADVPEDITYKNKAYKVLQRNMTWYQALEECKSKNMELVSITDLYQMSFITVTVSQANQPLWIGLNSRDDGNHYRWQDGSTVTMSRWSQDEQEEEDCVYVDVDGTWKTESCDQELPGAVCHIVTEQKEKKQEIACPHKLQDTVWIPYQNSCYTFLINHKRWTTTDHPYPCRSLDPDAYVLSIRDEDENLFIYNLLQPFRDLAKWVWLGMVHNKREDRLCWHDETYVSYSNWRNGRPNATNTVFYAAMKMDGFWDFFPNPRDFDLQFFQQHSIVACKIDKGPKEEHKEKLPDSIPYGNSKYYVLQTKVTWLESVKQCKKSGGHLASIHSQTDQYFLESIARKDGFSLWIGLWNNDALPNNLEWSDGTSVDYRGNLETPVPQGNCLYLDTKGNWLFKSCTETLDGAICYKPSDAKSKSESSDPLCPKVAGSEHWIRQNDFCYGFDVQIYNYSVFTGDQASKLCKSLDPTARLLTIENGEENAFVSRYLKDDAFMTGRVWLGVDSNSPDQAPKWLDGTSMKYNNWSTLQAEKPSQGYCTILLPETGGWSKVSCAGGQGRVVCKAPIRSSGVGVAVGFAVIIILILLIGLGVYLYKKRSPLFFNSIRYRRAEDQMESMIDYA
ncbi:lymphocyte antigen 75 [Hyperolius riggenbachi]|uniref:lymphocyte antigen 75 n=1 Tax=Hyperolius riggenbachi TaxID=752182 RepID=UPI0035A3B50C